MKAIQHKTTTFLFRETLIFVTLCTTRNFEKQSIPLPFIPLPFFFPHSSDDHSPDSFSPPLQRLPRASH
jgi:hypothetical protein